jgi:hypothetical protein
MLGIVDHALFCYVISNASVELDASLGRMQCLTRCVTEFYQIENEYGNLESSYGNEGKEYVKWAASMALSLGAGVPWVMCKQPDAPYDIVNYILFHIEKNCDLALLIKIKINMFRSFTFIIKKTKKETVKIFPI